MAGLIIGTLNFGKDDFLYGLNLCLHKAGRKAYRVSECTAAAVDVLLISAFWYYDAYHLRVFFEKCGLSKSQKNRPIIIIGGMHATMCPGAFIHFADYVFIGDADDHLGGILDQIEAGDKPGNEHLWDGTGKVPAPSVCKPSAFAMRKDKSASSVLRVEIARGCKFKCPFCAISNLKPYSEVPYSEIEESVSQCRGGMVSFFAPERTMHSEYDKICGLIKRKGFNDISQDARLENMHRVEKSFVTIGLEGISEKLRRSIKKPFSDEMILSRYERFVAKCKNVAMISAYYIADLPGESKSDFDEMFLFMEKLERCDFSRRLTYVPVLNPLSPKPFTDLNGSITHPFRNYEERWLKILRKGGSGQWGFRIKETLVWGPWERMLDSVVTHAGDKFMDICSKIPAKILSSKPQKNERHALAVELLKICRKNGLSESDMKIDLDGA